MTDRPPDTQTAAPPPPPNRPTVVAAPPEDRDWSAEFAEQRRILTELIAKADGILARADEGRMTTRPGGLVLCARCGQPRRDHKLVNLAIGEKFGEGWLVCPTALFQEPA